MGTIEKIASKDGTFLACQHTGDGPPLVLVHGTGGSAARWTPLLPRLEEHFSVYAMDRRGRGGSGDAPAYALEREFEDVASVVDSIRQPVNLLGHSFGGLCALEAALLAQPLRSLVLYERPLPVEGVTNYPAGVIERLEALLAAGDRAGVLTAFMRDVVRMPSHEFDLFRASPAWPARVAAAHTLPRELRVLEHYRFKARRFQELRVPTLLLVGGDSPAFFKAAIESLHSALPVSRIVVLPGQQHIAMDAAPDLFVHEVLAFLKEPG